MIVIEPLFRYITQMVIPDIRAVIFDYGGVLSLPQAAENRERMVSLSGLPGGLFWEEYRRQRPPYDRGDVDGETYWSRILALREGKIEPETVSALVREDGVSWSRINAAVQAWSRLLRTSGYKTAILSNIPADMIEHIQRRHAWLEEFQVRTYSCRLKTIKPEPAIYRHCLTALGVPAAEALFLDDTPENVAAAEALGMQALVFHSLEQAAPLLRQHYGLPSPPGVKEIPDTQPG
jgi:putative hydrolase of the HAD superfamily